jgi:hypothetical protein
MKYYGLRYCLKVWITSAAFAPFLEILLKVLEDRTPMHPKYAMLPITYLAYAGICLAMLLLPCVLLFLTFTGIMQSKMALSTKKLVMFIEVELAASLWLLFFYWMKDGFDLNMSLFFASFSVPTAFCILFHKLEPVDTARSIHSQL